MQLDTYLFFHGDCADALALYQSAFGAEIQTLIRFRDTPDAANVPCDGAKSGSREGMVPSPSHGRPSRSASASASCIASTMTGSNWLPAQARNSATASITERAGR